MDKACTAYFERLIKDARVTIEPIATKCLDNLSGFVDALYLTRQIDHDEEKCLRKKIMKIRLNRDILLSDPNLKRHIDETLGKANH